MNEKTSHQRHQLSQSNNKDGSRISVGQLMYRIDINRGHFVGRTQDNVNRGNIDIIKERTFNYEQVSADEKINDQQHRNDHCATTHIIEDFTDMCDNQSQDLAINNRQDINECYLSNDINIHSLDSPVPSIVVTK